MLPLREAIESSLALVKDRVSIELSLPLALSHYLTDDLQALCSLPRWSQSAMDGFAVRFDEAQKDAVLKIGEVIPAGYWPQQVLEKGQAARIFTGAPIPQGANAVVLQENCEIDLQNNLVTIKQSSYLDEHIRQMGEELQQGQTFAHSGDQVTPGLLGLCAAQGIDHLRVFERPKVAILETGSELVGLGQPLDGAQIYATNALTISPLIKHSGGQLIHCSQSVDSVDLVQKEMHHAFRLGAKILITTGGVSVGDFDPIHEALASLGAERQFWKVKMKPGKPVSVATYQDPTGEEKIIIGLPGNPVSCVVSYLLFVHPLLQYLSGLSKHQLGLKSVSCTLTHPLQKKHQRAEIYRVRLREPSTTPSQTEYAKYSCELTGGQSSAWISSISKADGLLYTPATPIDWQQGQTVEVAVLPWVNLGRNALLFNH